MDRSWFSIKNLTTLAEVWLYDEIGMFGIHAKDFITELAAIPDSVPILLRINSPGGTVSDGLAIYDSLLRRRGKVTVTVDGLAGSIASVVAMAGDTVKMPANSYMLIHDPIGQVEGNASDIRKLA